MGGLTEDQRGTLLLVAGLLGLASYVCLPSTREPELLPVYAAMLGLHHVSKLDQRRAERS